MSIGAAHGHAFLSYLWHYVLARLLYDELVQPLARDPCGALLAVGAVVVAVLILRRRRRSRR